MQRVTCACVYLATLLSPRKSCAGCLRNTCQDRRAAPRELAARAGQATAGFRLRSGIEAAGRADGERQQRPAAAASTRSRVQAAQRDRGSGMDERAVTAALREGDAVTYAWRESASGYCHGTAY